jgi:drug/metabolite transporter (DMT)-like permease
VVVVLTLASAFLHALWNALLRRAPDRESLGVVVVAIAAVTAAVVAAAGVVAGGAPFPDARGVAWSAAAGLFEAGYFVSLVLALGRGPLGPVYTVSRGGAIVIVWPISVLFMGEPVGALAVTGAAVVCAGLAATGLERAAPARSLVLATSCAAFIAGYHLCYKHALAAGGAPAAVFAVSLALAAPLNAAAMGRARRRAAWAALARSPVRVIVPGVMCAASFLLFLVALRAAGAGLILTLRNTSVLFATLLGWAIAEPPTRRQLAGALLVAAGAILLGVSRG